MSPACRAGRTCPHAGLHRVESPMEEAVETSMLMGFDPEGEPSVRRTAEGRLWLCFEFMPPSWAPDEQRAELGRGTTSTSRWSGRSVCRSCGKTVSGSVLTDPERTRPRPSSGSSLRSGADTTRVDAPPDPPCRIPAVVLARCRSRRGLPRRPWYARRCAGPSVTKRLLRCGLFEYKCYKCGLAERRGQPIVAKNVKPGWWNR